MQINELKVTVGEVCEGYFNDAEEGVVGYDERLDIRPKYQREFVYKDAQRDEVIRTVMKGLPLNVMYWCKVKKADGSDGFEVLDGQQRTISVNVSQIAVQFSAENKVGIKHRTMLFQVLLVLPAPHTNGRCPRFIQH